jgi:predicted nucleotidyltransferase
MHLNAQYPTAEHEKASRAVVTFFAEHTDIDSVILYGSCARGKASPGSCLDFMILVPPDVLSAKKDLENKWNTFYTTESVFKELHAVGKYSHVDLDFIDGQITPQPRHWTSGPDEFELEIGNTFVYSVPLREGDYFNQLKHQWLPYYHENLRLQRIAMVRKFCVNNLDHIPLFVERRLYFQAFNRLYDAFREFIQALFISRRTYPIAYDKWIKEQITEILKLPHLYGELVGILEINSFESSEIADKAETLLHLVETYLE